MAAQHVIERSEEQEGYRQTLKRRGILAAAAAAAVTAIMVKQTTQPVAAAAARMYADTATTVTNPAAGQTQLSGNYTPTSSPFNKPMLYVNNTSAFGSGVEGEVAGTGSGVFGKSATGDGVHGTSTGGNGVYGIANAAGTTQIVAGVFGDSTTSYGMIGRTTKTGYSGVTGITSTPGAAAFGGASLTAGAYAAYFSGTAVVEGDFYVVKHADGTGGGKFAAVAHRDGGYVGVYCTESPEPWFEDFGEAKVVKWSGGGIARPGVHGADPRGHLPRLRDGARQPPPSRGHPADADDVHR